jgi:hypothetical protein
MTVPKNIFLLRQNRAGNDCLVIKENDLPLRFIFSGKNYVVELTKNNKVIMKAE